jgi:tetratricopeptide (TPR) repeat protein
LVSVLLATWLLTGHPGFGQELRSAGFLEEAGVGFTRLYALDYEGARAVFSHLESRFPNHPGPPLYLASAIWLQELFGREDLDLDKFIAPGYFTEKTRHVMPEAEREAFLGAIRRASDAVSSILAENPQHREARYFEGSIAGVQGAFAITIDRNTGAAFRHGKHAYKAHSAIVAEDPGMADAYMTVGLYEYVVGSIPWYVKWLATIVGYRGSKERGLEYLGRAAEQARVVADDSRVLQMVLFVREKRYEEALANAELLHGKHPSNFLLHLNRAQILEKLGRVPEAAATYLQVEHEAMAGQPGYQKLPLANFRLQLVRRLQSWQRWDEAREVVHRGLETPGLSPAQRVGFEEARQVIPSRSGP